MLSFQQFLAEQSKQPSGKMPTGPFNRLNPTEVAMARSDSFMGTSSLGFGPFSSGLGFNRHKRASANLLGLKQEANIKKRKKILELKPYPGQHPVRASTPSEVKPDETKKTPDELEGILPKGAILRKPNSLIPSSDTDK